MNYTEAVKTAMEAISVPTNLNVRQVTRLASEVDHSYRKFMSRLRDCNWAMSRAEAKANVHFDIYEPNNFMGLALEVAKAEAELRESVVKFNALLWATPQEFTVAVEKVLIEQKLDAETREAVKAMEIAGAVST